MLLFLQDIYYSGESPSVTVFAGYYYSGESPFVTVL